MTGITRREAIKIASLAVATFSSIPLLAKQKDKIMLESQKLNSEEIVPKPLPFDPKKLNGISEKLIQSHWENNYIGSVKVLNVVNKKLAEAVSDRDFPSFEYNGLKREHLMRTGSVVYHELYFANLGGNGKTGGDIEKMLKVNFSDFNTWETEFKKMAQGLGGGSGWVVLGYNYHLKRLENYWSPDHLHSAPGTVPLLVMDMYEHSYQMDYGAAAGKYIEAFFKNIHWEVVEKRFESAKKIKWM